MHSPERIEAWVLSIVDVVKRKQPMEDDRVELKADWPEATKAARRVAGHANASGGGSVLWIVGLDEQRGVVPCTRTDPATWVQQLNAQFDGLPPAVTTLSVPTADGVVYALLFDTARRPFVVRNAVHGSQGGGPVAFEVPWREGTSVRSARREDLIRLLVPTLDLPTFEMLSASAKAQPAAATRETSATLLWSVSLQLYITPRSEAAIVLPRHRASLFLQTPGQPALPIGVTQMRPPYGTTTRTRSQVDSHTIVASSSEVIITGPGMLFVSGAFSEPELPLSQNPPPTADLSLRFIAAGDDRVMEIWGRLTALPPRLNAVGRAEQWDWNLTGMPSRP